MSPGLIPPHLIGSYKASADARLCHVSTSVRPLPLSRPSSGKQAEIPRLSLLQTGSHPEPAPRTPASELAARQLAATHASATERGLASCFRYSGSSHARGIPEEKAGQDWYVPCYSIEDDQGSR